VVVVRGDTEIVPAGARPLPTPWSIWTLVALVTFHINVVDLPGPISAGVAVNATMPGLPASPVCQKHEVNKSNKGINNNSFFIIFLRITAEPEYKNTRYSCQ